MKDILLVSPSLDAFGSFNWSDVLNVAQNSFLTDKSVAVTCWIDLDPLWLVPSKVENVMLFNSQDLLLYTNRTLDNLHHKINLFDFAE